MIRTILALLAGIVVAWLTINFFQLASAAVYPPPPGFDARDPQQLAALVANAPPTAMLLVLASWLAGAFNGSLVAGFIDRHRRRLLGWIIGALVTAGVVAMIVMVPHPLWMSAAGLLLTIPAALFGASVPKPRHAPPP